MYFSKISLSIPLLLKYSISLSLFGGVILVTEILLFSLDWVSFNLFRSAKSSEIYTLEKSFKKSIVSRQDLFSKFITAFMIFPPCPVLKS